jgi:hypothetical protein
MNKLLFVGVFAALGFSIGCTTASVLIRRNMMKKMTTASGLSVKELKEAIKAGKVLFQPISV